MQNEHQIARSNGRNYLGPQNGNTCLFFLLNEMTPTAQEPSGLCMTIGV